MTSPVPVTADLRRPGPGRRRARPGGLRRAGRLRELLLAGVADSFGIALGWTVIVLIATARGGLAEAALYNAAMLGGVVLSAPVTGWLSRHLEGRFLLRGAAAVEVLLRFGVLFALIKGAPPAPIAAGVVLMNIAAWAGFAGMRAEVSAVDASPRSMTRYAVCIAGVEAAGTALAALLPVGRHGYPTGWLLWAVFAVYLGSLLPTVLTARRARITPHGRVPDGPVYGGPAAGFSSGGLFPGSAAWGAFAAGAHAVGRRTGFVAKRKLRFLTAGFGVMLLAAGPTLLSVPVTEKLHGGRWVAAAAVAFSLGALLSTTAVGAIARLRLPTVLRWSLWGLGMLAGWTLAPAFAPMVVVAQFLAGLSQTAFEGDMDAQVADEAAPATVTRELAYSAAVRAFGGAIAVRLLPMLVAAPAIGTVAGISAVVLGLICVVIWTGLTTAPHLFRRLAH